MPLPKLFANARQDPEPLPGIADFGPVQPLAPAEPNTANPPARLEVATYKRQWQEHPNWCWAAVAASIANCFAPTIRWTQKLIVKATTGDESDLDPGFLQSALAETRNMSDKQPPLGPVREADIIEQIMAQRPIGCQIEWETPLGENTFHYVSITGYEKTAGSEKTPGKFKVIVEDPLYGHSTPTLENFAKRYRDNGTWKEAFYTQPATPPPVPPIA